MSATSSGRVVLIHRYFWPDTPPYAHILKEIACHLGDIGYDVTVLTCQPSYNRRSVGRAESRELMGENVKVHRWNVVDDRRSAVRKGLNLVVFCARVLSARRAVGDADVIMAASTPPIAIAKVTSWLAAWRGARFVYHKQDVYPEVVAAPGILRSRWLTRLLRSMDARTERKADRIVVLSEDMAETVRKRGTSADRLAIINNFDPWREVEPAVQSSEDMGGDRKRPMRVIFAGNLGRFQNLETLTEAMIELGDDPEIEFHIYGDGAMQDYLRDAVANHRVQNVWLHGYRQPDEIAKVLQYDADVGVVSVVPGVVRAAYPSKTMSYLRHGCPVLAIVEEDSELARSLERFGAGFQVDPVDPGSAADELRRLSKDRQVLADARGSAVRMYQESFSKERQLDRWAELFEDMASFR